MFTINSGAECVAAITRLRAAEFSDEEIGQVITELQRYLANPKVSDIIFYSGETLTPEQIVERARQYKPFTLWAPPTGDH